MSTPGALPFTHEWSDAGTGTWTVEKTPDRIRISGPGAHPTSTYHVVLADEIIRLARRVEELETYIGGLSDVEYVGAARYRGSK